MEVYIFVLVCLNIFHRACCQLNTTNTGETGDRKNSGLGTTGLVILLLAVCILFLCILIVVILFILRSKKRKLEERAKRASYVNHGYDNTEAVNFIQHSDSGSVKSAPPVKPSRRSSSKKSQNTNYENIEIGPNNVKLEEQFSSKSLPRNVKADVTLVEPNLPQKPSATGSIIPFIDASRNTLDKISEKYSSENINSVQK